MKRKKELETLIQTLQIYQHIRTEFGIEKSDIFIMKSGKRETAEEYNYQLRKALQHVSFRERLIKLDTIGKVKVLRGNQHIASSK